MLSLTRSMDSLTPSTISERVAELRAFNRFWTARIGALDAQLLRSAFSLTEARVLYELAQRRATELPVLRTDLDLDAGYLSRILDRFKAARLVTVTTSRTDRRRQLVTLTARGRRAFTDLDRRSRDDVRALLSTQPIDTQQRIVAAMSTIRRAFEPAAARSITLRPPRAGELGWIVERHGALYAAEYGWNIEFEALVARIVADYAATHDRAREAAWIAEVDGTRAGCVLCVARSPKVAQLRLLLVEPHARGLGIGGRLVDECIRFARDKGYREIVLWTNDVLHAARRLYERAGFRLVHQASHAAFGKRLREQTWSLRLLPR